MKDYDNLSTKKIFDKVKKSNSGSVITTASATISGVLIPIIYMLLDRINDTSNNTLIIALSAICGVTIVSTVIGMIIMNINKGSSNALEKDLDGVESFINQHFEIKNGKIIAKGDTDMSKMSATMPKKMMKCVTTPKK
ncbi:MAG: hypothetical protein HRK26_04895 [Rickettsiaceae bacterium H1]|nr:hypothetical protein [Rickettsiaceae bacterium H1]